MNLLFKLLLKGGIQPVTPLVVTNRASDSDTGVAPFAVQFDASGTTSINTTRPFHDLYHSWNFGDNDSVTWGYGTQAGVAKKNRASGPIAAHVYETPGTYTVSYLAIDPLTGQSAAATKTITVQDPDVVFAGANTICIANGTLPVAGVGGVPAGATCYNETTWAGVISRIASGKRVLLKKGDTWTTNSSNTITGAGSGGVIGAYGSGANPIVQLTLASSNVFSCTGSGNFIDWRIMDIDANATGLATGSARNATRFLNTPDGPTATSGRYATVLRCTHTNAGSFIYGSDSTTVADCVVTNLDGGAGNVGFWCYQRSNISILGCNFDNATAAEHCVRFQGVSKMVFQSNRVFQPANTKHTLTLRGYSDAGASYVWTGVYSEHCLLSGNEFIAGANNVTQVVTIKPQNGTSDERFRDIIFEKNYIEANVNYAYSFNTGGGIRITVRNNLTRLKTGSVGAILDNGSSWAGNSFAIIPPVDHAYYNNTTYASDTIAHGVDAIFVNTATATGLLFYNNIAYTPAYSGTKKNLNITAGSTYTEATNSSNAQMGATSPNFTATPPVAYTDWKCTSGYTINSGTTVPVYDDFFGAQRTYPTADLGAVNP